jgi:hypothetical protein
MQSSYINRKENTMTYTKPEIQSLGDAANVIQMTLAKGPFRTIDPDPPTNTHNINPAYDLDE